MLASSGGRTQQQEAPGSAIPVDLGAQQAEEFLQQLDLIEAHQLVPMGLEEQLRLLQPSPIAPVLQVEQHSIPPLGQQLAGQRGFAALPGAEQQGRRRPVQGLPERQPGLPWQITVHLSSVGAELHG